MKALLLLLTVLSTRAFACPDLTGNYKCTVGEQSGNISVTQATVNGVTTYYFGDSTAAADGKITPVPESTEIKDATFRAYCDGDASFNQELRGRYFSEKVYYGDLVILISFSKSGETLKQVQTRTISNHGGVFPIKAEQDCSRIP